MMNSVGKELVNYMKSFPGRTEHVAKDLMDGFTTQCVVKCAFSIEPGCFDPNQNSEFSTVLRKMYNTSFRSSLKFMFCSFFPKWMISLLPAQYVVCCLKFRRKKELHSSILLMELFQKKWMS